MKHLLLPLFCLFTYTLWSQADYAYKIVTDVFDASIPKGKYVLEGKISEEGSGVKLSAVSIQSEIASKVTKKSDKNGSFSITLGISETAVSFTKSGYKKSYFESYEIKDQHRIKIKIHLIKKGKVKEYTDEKPVVYCYTDKALDVTLSLKTNDSLTFTYPAFSEDITWQFHAEPNALLKTTTGTQVPYLFWESQSKTSIEFRKKQEQLEGQILSGKQVFSFLDSTLSVIGLNAQEKTDFITYWGPRMASQNYVFVQFLQDMNCEQFASYEVAPAPESFNRIFLVFSSFTEFPTFLNPAKQELSPMKRKGFYLVEWGGIEYPAEYIRNIN